MRTRPGRIEPEARYRILHAAAEGHHPVSSPSSQRNAQFPDPGGNPVAEKIGRAGFPLRRLRSHRVRRPLPIHPDHLPDPPVDPRNGFLLPRPGEPVGAPGAAPPHFRGKVPRVQGGEPPAGKSGPKRIILPDSDRYQVEAWTAGRIEFRRDRAASAGPGGISPPALHRADRQSPRANADDVRIRTRPGGRKDPPVLTGGEMQRVLHDPPAPVFHPETKKPLRRACPAGVISRRIDGRFRANSIAPCLFHCTGMGFGNVNRAYRTGPGIASFLQDRFRRWGPRYTASAG